MEKKETAQKKEKEGVRGPNGIHFDFKNTLLLSKYVNPHARMHGRKRSNLSGREPRLLAQAIKRARFMALMPYVAR